VKQPIGARDHDLVGVISRRRFAHDLETRTETTKSSIGFDRRQIRWRPVCCPDDEDALRAGACEVARQAKDVRNSADVIAESRVSNVAVEQTREDPGFSHMT
jgi:hypothetical protein